MSAVICHIRLVAWVRACLLGVTFACLCGVAEAQLPTVRVDGVAALVGGGYAGPGVAVILRSDVGLRAKMHLWSAGKAGVEPTPELLRAALDELIGEALIAGEAERLRVETPRAAAVAKERARIVEQMGGQASLEALLKQASASPHEILEMAERRAVVSLFLDANLEGENVVTEAAVDAALVAEGLADPATVGEERREAVRMRLSRQSLQRSVERWVRVLRARTVVRVFARYGER